MNVLRIKFVSSARFEMLLSDERGILLDRSDLLSMVNGDILEIRTPTNSFQHDTQELTLLDMFQAPS